jgi:hypothetical protein
MTITVISDSGRNEIISAWNNDDASAVFVGGIDGALNSISVVDAAVSPCPEPFDIKNSVGDISFKPGARGFGNKHGAGIVDGILIRGIIVKETFLSRVPYIVNRIDAWSDDGSQFIDRGNDTGLLKLGRGSNVRHGGLAGCCHSGNECGSN